MIRERTTPAGHRAWEVVDAAGRVRLDTLDHARAVQYDAELQPGAGPWLLQVCNNHSSVGQWFNRWKDVYRGVSLLDVQGAYKALKLGNFESAGDHPGSSLAGVWRIRGPAGGDYFGLGWYPGDKTEYPEPRVEGWVK